MLKPTPIEPQIKIEPEPFLRPQFPAFHCIQQQFYMETNEVPQQTTSSYQSGFNMNQNVQEMYNPKIYQQNYQKESKAAPFLLLPDRYNSDSNLYNKGLWSDEEHEAFLKGLKEIGRKWTRISREFVKTRDPNQVISHAQKYELRLRTEGKTQM
eukprot:gene8983-1082_t